MASGWATSDGSDSQSIVTSFESCRYRAHRQETMPRARQETMPGVIDDDTAPADGGDAEDRRQPGQQRGDVVLGANEQNVEFAARELDDVRIGTRFSPFGYWPPRKYELLFGFARSPSVQTSETSRVTRVSGSDAGSPCVFVDARHRCPTTAADRVIICSKVEWFGSRSRSPLRRLSTIRPSRAWK